LVVDYANNVTNSQSNRAQQQHNPTAGHGRYGHSAGVISELNGPRSLEKIGAGTLVLTAANTYSGPTAITAGTLIVNGNSAGGGEFGRCA